MDAGCIDTGMQQQYYLLREAARLLKTRPHIITYQLSNGAVPEPDRIGGRRCFSVKDLHRLAEKLGVELDLDLGEPDAN
jgi:DNA-binding transcriptional MerR regulator